MAPPLAEIRRHAGAEGFKPAMHYKGEGITTLLTLAAAGHGLTLLPEQSLSDNALTPPSGQLQGVAEIRAVGIAHPRVGHRIELIHTALPADSPAAALADILTRR